MIVFGSYIEHPRIQDFSELDLESISLIGRGLHLTNGVYDVDQADD